MNKTLAIAVQSFITATLVLAAPGQGPDAGPGLRPEALKGLWVGTASHAGETSPFALELEPGDDGKVLVKLTIPAIRLQGVPLGRLPVEIQGDDVRLGPFQLSYDRQSKTLDGNVPESLAPIYALPFTLHRADALDLPHRSRPDAPERKPLWTYEAGSQLWPGTSVANGLVLAGSDDGSLHALDPRTGERRWVFHAGAAIRTRAVVAGATVVFQADDGVLYAVLAATGKEAWRSRVAATPAVRKPFSDPTSRYDRYGSDITVAGDRLFLGTA